MSLPLKKGCKSKWSNQKAPKATLLNLPKLQEKKKKTSTPTPIPFNFPSSPRHRRGLAPGGGGIGTTPAELVGPSEGPDGALPGDEAHHGRSHRDAQVGKTSEDVCILKIYTDVFR